MSILESRESSVWFLISTPKSTSNAQKQKKDEEQCDIEDKHESHNKHT